ncbi:SiaC family regulatory phosphoprotein [Crocosphaera sp. XPORK-15E]|uniref:SiaC family regulatory phosphoprotein n=1 Tax=Crocosphaera sp. XPORK-15E TaxID=3110247 RepID=UPI002B22180B|nr:SiaC family regulatory phosphoprotein [Crocosphaera sp. XPORK-15E]MEA5536268.1 SiaC family regulatory phosphoprotein [Crocosphaera sp. XPORK-15E]
MEVKGDSYRVDYNAETITISFQGSLRLSGVEEYEPIVNLLNQVAEQNHETITLDLKELEFLNSSGISMLSKFVINIRKQKTSNILVKGSQSIPWQGKSLKNLQRLMPTLTLEFE